MEGLCVVTKYLNNDTLLNSPRLVSNIRDFVGVPPPPQTWKWCSEWRIKYLENRRSLLAPCPFRMQPIALSHYMIDSIGRGSSHNFEVGPWLSKSVPCTQHSWTKKSSIKVQEDARDDIEHWHWDVYVVADLVQLILCCSALNCAAAAADNTVTQLTNMQTKTEP